MWMTFNLWMVGRSVEGPSFSVASRTEVSNNDGNIIYLQMWCFQWIFWPLCWRSLIIGFPKSLPFLRHPRMSGLQQSIQNIHSLTSFTCFVCDKHDIIYNKRRSTIAAQIRSNHLQIINKWTKCINNRSSWSRIIEKKRVDLFSKKRGLTRLPLLFWLTPRSHLQGSW